MSRPQRVIVIATCVILAVILHGAFGIAPANFNVMAQFCGVRGTNAYFSYMEGVWIGLVCPVALSGAALFFCFPKRRS